MTAVLRHVRSRETQEVSVIREDLFKKRTVVGRQGQQGLFCWPKSTPHKYDGEVIPYRLFSLCHVISFLSDHSASLCCHAQSNLTKTFRIQIADSCLLEIN